MAAVLQCIALPYHRRDKSLRKMFEIGQACDTFFTGKVSPSNNLQILWAKTGWPFSLSTTGPKPR